MAALCMCPLDDAEEAPRRPSVAPPKVQQEPVMEEDTECNFLILFFIVGVIILALMDSM